MRVPGNRAVTLIFFSDFPKKGFEVKRVLLSPYLKKLLSESLAKDTEGKYLNPSLVRRIAYKPSSRVARKPEKEAGIA